MENCHSPMINAVRTYHKSCFNTARFILLCCTPTKLKITTIKQEILNSPYYCIWKRLTFSIFPSDIVFWWNKALHSWRRQWSPLYYIHSSLFPDICYLIFYGFSFHENLLKCLDLCPWTIYNAIFHFINFKWIFCCLSIFSAFYFAYVMTNISRWMDLIFFILIV